MELPGVFPGLDAGTAEASAKAAAFWERTGGAYEQALLLAQGLGADAVYEK